MALRDRNIDDGWTTSPNDGEPEDGELRRISMARRGTQINWTLPLAIVSLALAVIGWVIQDNTVWEAAPHYSVEATVISFRTVAAGGDGLGWEHGEVLCDMSDGSGQVRVDVGPDSRINGRSAQHLHVEDVPPGTVVTVYVSRDRPQSVALDPRDLKPVPVINQLKTFLDWQMLGCTMLGGFLLVAFVKTQFFGSE